MTYEVTVNQHFDAAHNLRGYQGKCEQLHGHRFQIAVTLKTEKLDELGLAFDFVKLKQVLGKVTGDLDHKCLNDIPPFDKINPSSENVASYIYDRMARSLQKEPVTLVKVQVWESPDSMITVYR